MRRSAAVVTVVACVLNAVGCTGRGGRPARNDTPPAPPMLATSTTSAAPTTVAVPAAGPGAVSARFALAYFSVPFGGDPDDRRLACRRYDTNRLDELLALPTWAGAANTTLPAETTNTVLNSLDAVDATTTTADYEIDVTASDYDIGGRLLATNRLSLELQLVDQPAGGGWLVDQASLGP